MVLTKKKTKAIIAIIIAKTIFIITIIIIIGIIMAIIIIAIRKLGRVVEIIRPKPISYAYTQNIGAKGLRPRKALNSIILYVLYIP